MQTYAPCHHTCHHVTIVWCSINKIKQSVPGVVVAKQFLWRYVSRQDDAHHNLPEDIRRARREVFIFRRCPPSGVEMDVEDVDTHVDRNSKKEDVPTILAVHGAPGTHRDFAQLIEHFAAKGVRVIAPTFPSKAFNCLPLSSMHNLSSHHYRH